jgi:hypothetical protein
MHNFDCLYSNKLDMSSTRPNFSNGIKCLAKFYALHITKNTDSNNAELKIKKFLLNFN